MFNKQDQRTDVVFISPLGRRGHIYLPFALLALSSYLEKNKITTKLIDIKNDSMIISDKKDPNTSFFEHVVKTVLYEGPVLVGLTCYTCEYNKTIELANFIKRRTDAKIVVGGIHATLRPQEFIYKDSPVDFVIAGDGETPLLGLIESLKNNNNEYKYLNSVGYFDYENNTAKDLVVNMEEDLSSFPMFNYEKINMDFYLKPTTGNIRFLLMSGVQIFTSRGCPYNCYFCAVNSLREKNRNFNKVRYRPVKQVLDELTLLRKRYKIDGFYILDDCFMLSRDRTADFCNDMIKKRLNLVWGFETRANLIQDKDSSLLKLMKRAGLLQIDLGIESGSQAMLNEINKGITVGQIKKAVYICKKNDIRVYANIMVNLPNEKEEDIFITKNFLRSIKPSSGGAAITVPLLDTKIYKEYVKPALLPLEYDIYNSNVYEEIVDPRFKLASHNLDLAAIVADLNKKYYHRFIDFSFSIKYWKAFFKSKYLLKYIYYILSGIKSMISVRAVPNED